jgi:hypothetical protein
LSRNAKNFVGDLAKVDWMSWSRKSDCKNDVSETQFHDGPNLSDVLWREVCPDPIPGEGDFNSTGFNGRAVARKFHCVSATRPLAGF